MARILLITGYLTWDAVERRSDRYGTVNFHEGNYANDDDSKNVLLDPSFDRLEGCQGKLIAEVVKPVKTKHVGDLHRKILPSLPSMGAFILLGEGSLFIEHRGRAIHEEAEIERTDARIRERMISDLKAAGVKVTVEPGPLTPALYDVIGLRPTDGRETDWLDPRALYRVHSSKVRLWFEEM